MTGDNEGVCPECGRLIVAGDAEPVGEVIYCSACFDDLAARWESRWDRVRGVD